MDVFKSILEGKFSKARSLYLNSREDEEYSLTARRILLREARWIAYTPFDRPLKYTHKEACARINGRLERFGQLDKASRDIMVACLTEAMTTSNVLSGSLGYLAELTFILRCQGQRQNKETSCDFGRFFKEAVTTAFSCQGIWEEDGDFPLELKKMAMAMLEHASTCCSSDHCPH